MQPRAPGDQIREATDDTGVTFLAWADDCDDAASRPAGLTRRARARKAPPGARVTAWFGTGKQGSGTGGFTQCRFEGQFD